MDVAWFYIAVTLVIAGAALLLRRAVKDQPFKEQIWAWLSIVVGIGFFLLYVTRFDRDVLVLVLGLVCTFTGAHALEVGRLRDRIRRLEDNVERHAPSGT
jgi:hypothetical protein